MMRKIAPAPFTPEQKEVGVMFLINPHRGHLSEGVYFRL